MNALQTEIVKAYVYIIEQGAIEQFYGHDDNIIFPVIFRRMGGKA